MLALWAAAYDCDLAAPSTADDVRRLIAHRPGALLVAARGETVMGSLIATWDGWRGNLYRLAVAPGERRRGVAVALVRAGEEALKAASVRRISALTRGVDIDAHRLWTSAGYRQEPGTLRFVRDL